MCEAGRIRHHLKHNLWRAESTILFVGYQAVVTLGRAIVEGEREVKLFGEKVQVNAEIAQLAGISGHADNEGLIRWVKSFDPAPKHVFVNHGEDSVCEVFAARLRDELKLEAHAPFNGARVEIRLCTKPGVRPAVAGGQPLDDRYQTQRGRREQGFGKIRRPDFGALRKMGQIRTVLF